MFQMSSYQYILLLHSVDIHERKIYPKLHENRRFRFQVMDQNVFFNGALDSVA